jgi:SAM-dependent methyltransferase
VLGLAQTFYAQGAELLRNPGRTGGWDQVDVGLLQGIGRMSMSVAGAIRAAAQAQPNLAEQLTGDVRILDVGTGTGWLAIALAEAYPEARVVGIDIFAPALELARANVSAANLDARIELRQQDALDVANTAEFSATWLPLPFLPAAIVPAVLEAVRGSLRPGGCLVAGTFAPGGPGRLAELLMDLRTLAQAGGPGSPTTAARDDLGGICRPHSSAANLNSSGPPLHGPKGALI